MLCRRKLLFYWQLQQLLLLQLVLLHDTFRRRP